MIIIFIRTVSIFILLLIVMRIMGKRQIGEMQPFEFVITLVIAELACIPMTDVSIPLIYGITAILAIFILHQIISIFEQSFSSVKFLVSGKPSLVLNKDGVDFQELKKNNLDIEDLIESMRSGGYFSLDDLDYGIFESNGKFSAKEKTDYDSKKTALPILLVGQGKIIDNNLKIANVDSKFVMNIIKEQKTKSLKNVGVMTLDGNGKIYYQEEGKKYVILNANVEVNKW